jgi:hypothetical protein
VLGLTNLVFKEVVERGGIVVFWRRGDDVTLRNLSVYHIDMEVMGRMVFFGGSQECMENCSLTRSIKHGRIFEISR